MINLKKIIERVRLKNRIRKFRIRRDIYLVIQNKNCRDKCESIAEEILKIQERLNKI